MQNRNKVLYTVIILTVIVVAISFIVINLTNSTNKSVKIRTDKKAITSRFPNIGEFEKCYWKGDVLGKNVNRGVPGPTSYWMSGFVEIDKNKLTTFIEKYKMQQLSESPKLKFKPKNYDESISKWYYSDMFNDYIISPGFTGKFYIDTENSIIYFNVIGS